MIKFISYMRLHMQVWESWLLCLLYRNQYIEWRNRNIFQAEEKDKTWGKKALMRWRWVIYLREFKIRVIKILRWGNNIWVKWEFSQQDRKWKKVPNRNHRAKEWSNWTEENTIERVPKKARWNRRKDQWIQRQGRTHPVRAGKRKMNGKRLMVA